MIQFNYLYRDYSNYKNYGSIVLWNSKCLDISEIDRQIRDRLIDGEFFYPDKVGLPTLFFEIPNCDDHELHEFVNIETTNQQEYILTIEEFILQLQ